LTEAEEWAAHQLNTSNRSFSDASITRPHPTVAEAEQSTLGPSRAYCLSLAPQLVYARSTLLPTLVSSRTHGQLEFQAVGSFFTANAGAETACTRVPSGREDVFKDDTLDLRAKRSLMKFLRFVGNYEEEQERWSSIRNKKVTVSLREDFGLHAEAAVAPLLALALTSGSAMDTSMEHVVPRIARHLRSTGMFGAGFAAVLPKWGGLAEIAQVACRACAVGGGVYVLNKGITSTSMTDERDVALELSEGEKVTTKWLVGCPEDSLTSTYPARPENAQTETVTRSISIVSSPLISLFPPTSEGGVTPAGAVVAVEIGDTSTPPVHILVHSSDSGDCPVRQCKSLLPSSTQPTMRLPCKHCCGSASAMMNHENMNTYLHCPNFIDDRQSLTT